ncbi:11078_t:CDS:2 [Entrophospora sp. SA101]|nr:11078_t:CDS:2 [Entrophospora sp. SA101]
MTLEQRRRRRSNSAESLEINILPSSIGSHHSDSDKRNSTRQSNPIVMPSWSLIE